MKKHVKVDKKHKKLYKNHAKQFRKILAYSFWTLEFGRQYRYTVTKLLLDTSLTTLGQSHKLHLAKYNTRSFKS